MGTGTESIIDGRGGVGGALRRALLRSSSRAPHGLLFIVRFLASLQPTRVAAIQLVVAYGVLSLQLAIVFANTRCLLGLCCTAMPLAFGASCVASCSGLRYLLFRRLVLFLALTLVVFEHLNEIVDLIDMYFCFIFASEYLED